MKIPSETSRLFLLFVCLALSASAGAETVIFRDTFETRDGEDVNADIEIRQSGGSVTSDYKKLGSQTDQSSIASNQLKRTGPGELDLTTNFADKICGKSFSLSADIQCLSLEGWGAISMLGDTASTRERSPLSVRLHGKGLVVVSSGHAGENPAPVETVFSPVQIGKILDGGFSVADAHNYKFVVTERGGTDHVAFFIDGIELPLKDDTVEFGDETKRIISFINVNNADTNILYDNLTLTIDPSP